MKMADEREDRRPMWDRQGAGPPRKARGGASVAAFAIALAVANDAHAAPTGRSPFPDVEGVERLLGAVKGADLVLLDEPRHHQATRILLATRVDGKAEKIAAVVTDPATYRRAIPSFRRAEVVRSAGADKLVEWELEVPLWNLDGKLWLRPRPGGVDLELAEGDLAPGLFIVRAVALAGGGALLTIEARANVRNANWVARRLVTRSFHAEAAMTAASAWVLLRALVLEVERGTAATHPARWPKVKMAPPPLQAIDGRVLAAGFKAAVLPAGMVAAAVRTRPDGRLERVEVAVTARNALAEVRKHVSDPMRWKALPGWRQIRVSPDTGGAAGAVRWEIDTKFPFVDFDSTWVVFPGPPLRGQAVAGDCRGAVMGWDLAEGPRPRSAVATFSFHPRLETAGYIPRKFIEAEPLLEQALSLGLAYVNAASLVRSLEWSSQAAQAKRP